MEGIFHKEAKENEDEENENELDLRDSLATNKSIDQELHERFKPKAKKSPKNIKLTSQKFGFDKKNGFIYCLDNPQMVFGVLDADTNLNEVFLVRKSDDSVNQRWHYKPNGIIISKARSNMVLTVKLASIEEADIELNLKEEDDDKLINIKPPKKNLHAGASIILQPLIDTDFGNAHQRWFIDDSIGFIYAFATSEEKSIEVMAANKANLCSYYVTYDKEVSQPVNIFYGFEKFLFHSYILSLN